MTDQSLGPGWTPATDFDGKPCQTYTGSPQRFPAQSLGGESQATISQWDAALRKRGRDVLTDGTLSNDDPVTRTIRVFVASGRQGFDLLRLVSKRMADFRSDNPELCP